ncbi:MAG: pyridoxamine 5'-phosphate oxidase [Bacteroidetes bacterium]|nr:pyridoxamine 5'-phosphate oxidase [Bacteroidota bacterium]
MKDQISKLRTQYQGELLDEKNVFRHPAEQFKVWFNEALISKISEPNAMTLATASKEGIPSVRIVLLKDFDERGFTFYTNYNSQKGKEINENPNAAILFFWPQLHRQIRIEGTIEQIDPAISEKYFYERPFESQISAWISPQSAVIDNKKTLETRYKDYQAVCIDKQIPYPPFWGGYCLKPNKYEFWQGQPNRLHDRVKYILDPENDKWIINRIAP